MSKSDDVQTKIDHILNVRLPAVQTYVQGILAQIALTEGEGMTPEQVVVLETSLETLDTVLGAIPTNPNAELPEVPEQVGPFAEGEDE